MTPDQALQNLVLATGQLEANRDTHQKILVSIQVLEKFIKEKTNEISQPESG